MPQKTYATTDEINAVMQTFHLKNLHIKTFEELGFHAIIAIHNTLHSRALGGCRFKKYSTINEALADAGRLAQAMSYKSAINQLPFGGGKAVLMPIKEILDRRACFEKFGEFVNDLKGSYITAVDVGVELSDLDCIAQKTSYVTGLSRQNHGAGNPSPFTAYGVRRCIEAAVMQHLGKSSLKGVHVAIQGVGSVGYELAKDLATLGALLTVSDVNQLAASRCEYEFAAQVVPPNQIYGVKCDVFSPCSLGAILNRNTLPLIKASIVAGAANNQLADEECADLFHAKNILLIPDYIINSGGLLFVSALYQQTDFLSAQEKIKNLYDTIIEILTISKKEDCSPYHVANAVAQERLSFL